MRGRGRLRVEVTHFFTLDEKREKVTGRASHFYCQGCNLNYSSNGGQAAEAAEVHRLTCPWRRAA